jgi:hypothetical protein
MAITYVQSNKGYVAGSTSNVTFGLDVAAHSLIVVVISKYGGSPLAADAVTDNHSNTYHQVATITYSGDTSLQLCTYYAYNVASGATTVTWACGSSTSISMAIHEYSGVAYSADPLDQEAHAQATSGTAANSGNVTTTETDELLFGMVNEFASGTVTIAADGSYTLRQKYENNSTQMTFGSADQIVTATGTYSAAFTLGSSCGWISRILTFKTAPILHYTLPPATIARRMTHMLVR